MFKYETRKERNFALNNMLKITEQAYAANNKSEDTLKQQLTSVDKQLELQKQRNQQNYNAAAEERIKQLEHRKDQLSSQLDKLNQQKNTLEIDEKDNGECETCKNRKYQDGSDEMVSFKSPAHISPQAAGSAVRAHEQEHVANAYKKAGEGNGKVVQASVQIHTAICPECGRSYVAGGTTSTQIKYYNEDNPYQQDLKQQDADRYRGMNIDTGI